MSNLGVEGDHEEYKNMFAYPDKENSRDLIFYYLIVIVRELGVTSYNSFLLIEYCIVVLLSYLGLKNITNNYHALLPLVMIYILPHCAVALRFCLGLSIILYSFKYLDQKKFLFFVICFVVASLVHYTLLFCAIMMIIFFVNFNNKNAFFQKASKIFLLSIFVIIAIYYFSGDMLGISNYLSLFLSGVMGERGVLYLEAEAANNGPLLFVPSYLTSLALAYLINKDMQLHMEVYSINNGQYIRISKEIFLINVLFAPALLFVFFTMTFCRLLFIPSILSVCMYERYKSLSLSFNLRNKLIPFIYLLNIVAWIIPCYWELFSIGCHLWIKDAVSYLNQ